MSTTSILDRAGHLLLGLFAAAVIGTSAAGGPAQQRPIEDFVMAQGALVPLFGPFAFMTWTDPAEDVGTLIDYAGLVDSVLGLSLGTEFSGSVTERALPDGRALVHVRLHTTNALSIGIVNSTGEIVFGSDPGAVLMGAEPGLGTSHLNVKLINTAPGAPLPDILVMLLCDLGVALPPGFCTSAEFLSLEFVANAAGPLPDGTSGCLHTTQTGPLLMGVDFNDGFVAEFIDIFEGPCE
jgi:hypothetical protein